MRLTVTACACFEEDFSAVQWSYFILLKVSNQVVMFSVN